MMALVDGDLYLYRTLAATEEETDWGDDVWSLTSDLKVAKTNFDKLIKRYVEECGVDWFCLCFSDRLLITGRFQPTICDIFSSPPLEFF